jgi:hypothetical protein
MTTNPATPVELMTQIVAIAPLVRRGRTLRQPVKQSRFPLEIAPFFAVVFDSDIAILGASAAAVQVIGSQVTRPV